MLPQAGATPERGAGCPELPSGVGKAEPALPGEGERQVERVADERGGQCVPRGALWAGLGR